METLSQPAQSTENQPTRCAWLNLNNPLYVAYHDQEWGVPQHDDNKLFEMLMLESFQAGLSWECILNKREAFRQAFDDFDFTTIARYTAEMVEILLKNPGIIRHRGKIEACINNARIFGKIRADYGTFDRYIWGFTQGKSLIENGLATSPLSDCISKDLKRRGMKFVGSVTVYSYLQAIGIINSHDEKCYLHPCHKQVNRTS